MIKQAGLTILREEEFVNMGSVFMRICSKYCTAAGVKQLSVNKAILLTGT